MVKFNWRNHGVVMSTYLQQPCCVLMSVKNMDSGCWGLGGCSPEACFWDSPQVHWRDYSIYRRVFACQPENRVETFYSSIDNFHSFWSLHFAVVFECARCKGLQETPALGDQYSISEQFGKYLSTAWSEVRSKKLLHWLDFISTHCCLKSR